MIRATEGKFGASKCMYRWCLNRFKSQTPFVFCVLHLYALRRILANQILPKGLDPSFAAGLGRALKTLRQ